MKKESQLAYAEVDAILDMLETEAVEKVPLKVREFFKNEKDKNYIPKISEDLSEFDNISDSIICFANLIVNSSARSSSNR